jgi:hypothetical protein
MIGGSAPEAVEPFSAHLDLQAYSSGTECPFRTFSRQRQAADGTFVLKSGE